MIRYLLYGLLAAGVYAASPEDALPLPAPAGKVIEISDVEQIYRALVKLESNTTLLLAKGTYQLHKPIQINPKQPLKNIVLRGATRDFNAVVLRGAGMNNDAVYHGIMAANVEGLTIADLTIGWVGYHAIQLQPGVKKVHIHHCRLVDAGEQFIKASLGKARKGVDHGRVEFCLIEYSGWGPPNGYTNGVDVHRGMNWVIRHNLFRNIRSPKGAQHRNVPAVLMWNGSKNTLCEGNSFVNCDRAIAFGNTNKHAKEGLHDHEGGIIRNNFVYVDPKQVPHADAGICAWDSPGTKIRHNTVLLNGAYPNAIEARWTDASVQNNLSDSAIAARDGATLDKAGNFTRIRSSDFVAPDKGLPLMKRASANELRKVRAIRSVFMDWTHQSVRTGSQARPGALER